MGRGIAPSHFSPASVEELELEHAVALFDVRGVRVARPAADVSTRPGERIVNLRRQRIMCAGFREHLRRRFAVSCEVIQLCKLVLETFDHCLRLRYTLFGIKLKLPKSCK